MARGESGRIVIEVEPETKRRLYEALAVSGSTLKDWFLQNAKDFCRETTEPSLFSDAAPRAKLKEGPGKTNHKAHSDND